MVIVLIGTDFLWKAMPVGKLRALLADCADEDWIFADPDGDFAIIKEGNLERLKDSAYPSDAVVDVVQEQWKESD